MDPDRLYYAAQPGGTPQGPWTAAAIAAMARSGQLQMDSLVWTEGMAGWQPVSAILDGVPCPSAWNPIVAFKTCLKRYCRFSGRASRPEYWFFVLAGFLLNAAFEFLFAFLIAPMTCSGDIGLEYALATSLLWIISMLALLPPGLAALVRRLHDAGRSGWWFFVSFIPLIGVIWLLVLLCCDSAGPNKYGASPDGPHA